MIKKKVTGHLLSVAIVICSLIFAGFVSFLLALHSQPSQAKVSDKVFGVTKTASISVPSLKPSASVEVKPVIKTVSYATPTPIPSNTPQVITPTPVSTQSPQTNQVNVSINGSSSFTLSITDGSNQCDVLNKALAEGKISSLNMRYDQNFGTYAVYQINGIGKENSVWWTYTVNGQSPNQGCSFIKAKNNDNVEWKYIGS